MTHDPPGDYHRVVDFLDKLTTATKGYVVIGLLLGAGLLIYDCGPSEADIQRSSPAGRSVR